MSAPTNIRVLIADDHSLFAKLIQQMLRTSSDIEVVGIVTNGKEVVEYAENHDIDLILLDIDMPIMDGMQTLGKIVKNKKDTRIIMLSNHTEAWLVQKALKIGASGYISKYADSNEVVEAIVTVHNGGNYFCKTSFKNLMDRIANKKTESSHDHSYHELTKREMEVLKLIAKEFNSKEISDQLCISPRTVETHRKNILQKLGAKNTVGLIKAAMGANLIPADV